MVVGAAQFLWFEMGLIMKIVSTVGPVLLAVAATAGFGGAVSRVSVADAGVKKVNVVHASVRVVRVLMFVRATVVVVGVVRGVGWCGRSSFVLGVPLKVAMPLIPCSFLVLLCTFSPFHELR